MPIACRYSAAAPSAIDSAMAGVPASNFQGRSFQLVRSSSTLRIISPPVRNGGIRSSSSARPHRMPAPGPHILWPERA